MDLRDLAQAYLAPPNIDSDKEDHQNVPSLHQENNQIETARARAIASAMQPLESLQELRYFMDPTDIDENDDRSDTNKHSISISSGVGDVVSNQRNCENMLNVLQVTPEGYKPAPGDEGYKSVPGDQRYKLAPGDERYKPAPGDQRYKPAPGDEGYKPALGDEGYKPASGDQPCALESTDHFQILKSPNEKTKEIGLVENCVEKQYHIQRVGEQMSLTIQTNESAPSKSLSVSTNMLSLSDIKQEPDLLVDCIKQEIEDDIEDEMVDYAVLDDSSVLYVNATMLNSLQTMVQKKTKQKGKATKKASVARKKVSGGVAKKKTSGTTKGKKSVAKKRTGGKVRRKQAVAKKRTGGKLSKNARSKKLMLKVAGFSFYKPKKTFEGMMDFGTGQSKLKVSIKRLKWNGLNLGQKWHVRRNGKVRPIPQHMGLLKPSEIKDEQGITHWTVVTEKDDAESMDTFEDDFEDDVQDEDYRPERKKYQEDSDEEDYRPKKKKKKMKRKFKRISSLKSVKVGGKND